MFVIVPECSIISVLYIHLRIISRALKEIEIVICTPKCLLSLLGKHKIKATQSLPSSQANLVQFLWPLRNNAKYSKKTRAINDEREGIKPNN